MTSDASTLVSPTSTVSCLSKFKDSAQMLRTSGLRQVGRDEVTGKKVTHLQTWMLTLVGLAKMLVGLGRFESLLHDRRL